MENLKTLKNIASYCYNSATKEVVALENQIENIRAAETKLSLIDENRIGLRASRRVKKETLEYYRGLQTAYKIMMEAVNDEMKLKEIEEVEFLMDMEELERSNAIPVI